MTPSIEEELSRIPDFDWQGYQRIQESYPAELSDRISGGFVKLRTLEQGDEIQILTDLYQRQDIRCMLLPFTGDQARRMITCVEGLAQKVDLISKLPRLVANYPHDVAVELVSSTAKVARSGVRDLLEREYVDSCMHIEWEKFDCHAIEEFRQHFVHISRMVRKGGYFISLVAEEKDFLNQQSSETLVPMIKILRIIDKKYRSHIKQMGSAGLRYLANAYAIAENNEEEGHNLVFEFMDGLRGTLNTYPDKVGDWARSVCDDFKRQGEAGLLREVSG